MQSSLQIRLSVVVAAYNEEAVIRENIKRIVATLNERPNVSWELVLVNDGSSDKTGEILDRSAEKNSRIKVFHHFHNFGQGRAIRTAFAECTGDFIVTLDADLSYSPQYIWVLLDALIEEHTDICLASPYVRDGRVRNVPLYRHILSRGGNKYLAKMSHYNISTSTCVVRAYRRSVIDSLHLTSDGMELQVEILMKSAMMGLKVVEKPAVLEWAHAKLEEANLLRVSKMKILRAIRLYLMMGWLFRPALVFILVALVLILPGIYMAAALAFRALALLGANLDSGLAEAVSIALSGVFETYPYSVIFCGGFLLLGVQLLVISLVILQNQFHFQELYRLVQGSGLPRQSRRSGNRNNPPDPV
ncbi:MAG TPA: glycosyltransferase family 2 protein [Desulfobacterales bacterium]|nr:glycosyltransferase family 2 protein [Desulfobacterales bacterium]